MKFSVAALAPTLLLSSWVLAGCHSRSSGPLWDVPALVGQPIDRVEQTIGSPPSAAGAVAALQQSTWKRGDSTLSATWKPANKRVTSWTLMSRDDAHAVSEEERNVLLLPGQLKENDPRYSLDWIEAAERPLFYTGVRVVPAPRNHLVVLRLSGSPSLVQVSYTISGAQAKTDTTLTIAPWEETFTLPDDSQIALSAIFLQATGAGKNDMKIEIVADGKTVASAAKTGGAIRCGADL